MPDSALSSPGRTPAARLPTHLLTRLAALLSALLVLALSACASSASTPHVPEPQQQPATSAGLDAADVTAWLDGMLPAALADAGIAGASVVVVHDGRTVLSRGYGRADTGTGDTPARPVDPATTLFRVGSVSKVFTATAAMQLVEQGRIDLDADVNEYLDFRLPEPKGRITVRTLLTHTAGFEERVRPLIEPTGTPLDLRSFVADDPPEQVFAPGTVPAYSNYGNSLVGYVVQRVSGEPFERYVQRHVLERAGMTSSSFDQPLPDGLAGQMAAGYADDTKPATAFELVAAAPAGALSTTADDMGRFLLAQLGDVPAAHRLLTPRGLEQLHAPALGADTLGTLTGGPRMALGFFDASRDGHAVVGHDGDTGVFHAAFEVLPDDGAGVFVAFNSTGRPATATADLRAAVMHGFVDRYFGTPAAPAALPATQDAPVDPDGHAALAAGTYESSRAPRSTFLSMLRLNSQTHVTAQPDGSVVISPRPNGYVPARYAEVAPWVWREVGGQELVTMRVADGQVAVLGFDSAFTVLRVDPAHDAALVVPLVVAAYAVLALSLLLAPVAALVRRRHGVRLPDNARRLPLRLTRVGVAGTLAAALGWYLVVASALAFTDVADAWLRVVQAFQVVGLLALVPAAWQLVTAVRRRGGALAVGTAALVLLALVVVACFAVTFRLVAPSVSY